LDVKSLYEQIKNVHDSAFEARDIISEINKGIEESEQNGISIIQTKKVLYLAEVAFNRGDYVLALQRLKEAKLTYAIETKGEFNIYKSIVNNPLQSLGALIGLSFFSLSSSVALRLSMYKRKSRILQDEEKLLLELMKIIQHECFSNNRMSMEEYEEAMNQYETRLSDAIEEKIRVNTKIANILKLKGKSKALAEERTRLISLIKDIQDQYLNKKEMETRVYGNMLKSYSSRLNEVEEQITFLEAEDALRGNNFIVKIFKFIKIK
jgi:hypothetical protein